MRQQYFVLLLFAFLMTILGCAANTGTFLAVNQTTVELSQPNYQIVATNLTGEAVADYFLGASFSMGAVTNTVALIRVNGTGMLYQEALENLWAHYEKKFGSVEGKKLALINVRYDSQVINLFFYTQAKISVRADVIEFGK